MAESIKIKDQSQLVQSVLALDNYFSELLRLGNRIESLDLKSEFDFEQAQRLITHFTECGHGVAREVVVMSNALNEARANSEAIAQVVAQRAEQLQARKSDEQKKMDEFRQLGERVRDLTSSLNELKLPEGGMPSADDRAKLSMRLSEVELQLQPLIEEATRLKKEAQSSRMRVLEQGADSLSQSLLAVSKKLSNFQQVGFKAH